MSRLQTIIDNLVGTENPDDLMQDILDALPETIPARQLEVGNYCTFVYSPKTPFISYDQNPLVAVFAVEDWGIRGLNYHWEQVRNYSWEEFVGDVHLFNSDELSDMRSIPFQNYRLNI